MASLSTVLEVVKVFFFFKGTGLFYKKRNDASSHVLILQSASRELQGIGCG